MKHPFIPDLLLASKDEVTPALLKKYGVTSLICDIDNTLAPYTSPDPSSDVARWCAALTDAGIKLALVSNNSAERVERFNKTLGLPAFAKCGKPKKKGLLSAVNAIGADAGHTAFLGDQLFTDVLAARRCGFTAFLVPPIEPVETAFFRFKRMCERPFLRRYNKKINKSKG